MSGRWLIAGASAFYLAALLGACGDLGDDGDDDDDIPVAGRSGSSGTAGSALGGLAWAGAAGAGGAAGEGDACAEAEAAATTVTATWKLLEKSGNGPSPRFSVSVAPLKDQLLLFGGGTFLTGGSNETWLYDLVGDRRWNLDTSMGTPPARGAQALLALDEQRAFLFGGQGLELYNDAWLWNGKGWQAACEGSTCGEPPTARAGHALTLDRDGSRVVLMGGQDPQGIVGDTWSWSEQAGWQQLCSSECDSGAGGAGNGVGDGAGGIGGAAESTAPCCGYGPRFDHAAASDPATSELLMYGGHDGNKELASLWSFADDTWQELKLEGKGPSARSGHALAFDAGAGLFVLYGGTRDGQAVQDELWAYAPNTERWYPVEVSGEAPPSRGFGGFAYDPGRQQLLLFGGSAQGTYGDLWSLQVSKHVAANECSCLAACESCPRGDRDACSLLCGRDFDFPDARCAQLPGADGAAGAGGGGSSAGAPNAGSPTLAEAGAAF
jgi:hypothetical protein